MFGDLHGVSDVQVDLHFLNSVQELQENACESAYEPRGLSGQGLPWFL